MPFGKEGEWQEHRWEHVHYSTQIAGNIVTIKGSQIEARSFSFDEDAPQHHFKFETQGDPSGPVDSEHARKFAAYVANLMSLLGDAEYGDEDSIAELDRIVAKVTAVREGRETIPCVILDEEETERVSLVRTKRMSRSRKNLVEDFPTEALLGQEPMTMTSPMYEPGHQIAFILTGDKSGKPTIGKVVSFNEELGLYLVEIIKGEDALQVKPSEILKRVFLGYHEDEDMPVKRGDMVTIVKGTMVKTVGKAPKPAGRTYQVKVDHTLCGSARYRNHREEVFEMTNPKVCWPGPGGYWSEADLNDIPEAQPPVEHTVKVDGRTYLVDVSPTGKVNVFNTILGGVASGTFAGEAVIKKGKLTGRDSDTLSKEAWEAIAEAVCPPPAAKPAENQLNLY